MLKNLDQPLHSFCFASKQPDCHFLKCCASFLKGPSEFFFVFVLFHVICCNDSDNVQNVQTNRLYWNTISAASHTTTANAAYHPQTSGKPWKTKTQRSVCAAWCRAERCCLLPAHTQAADTASLSLTYTHLQCRLLFFLTASGEVHYQQCCQVWGLK